MAKDSWWKLTLVPALGIAISFALPFVHWPEMLNWPHFMAHGWLPYRDFAMIDTPVLPSLLLIFYKTLGFTPVALQIFGALVIAASDFLLGLFLLTKEKRLTWILIWQSLFLLLTFAMGGNTVWFESLLTPILLGIFWCQHSFLEKPKTKVLIVSGLLFGLALIIKQTSAYTLPAILLFFFFLWKKNNPSKTIKAALVFSFAAITPIILMLLILALAGVLPDFWRWGVIFVFHKPFESGGGNSYVLLPSLKQIALIFALFVLAAYPTLKKISPQALLALSWALVSFLFSVPRFDYFHLLPMVGFLVAALAMGKKILVPTLTLFILGTAVLVLNLKYQHTFLEPEVLSVADRITNLYFGQSLFVLNGPDQLYFLTGKMPAVKPWIPQLAWYYGYYTDSQFLKDIIDGSPDVIVFYPYRSFAVQGLGAYEPTGVGEYLQNKYQLRTTFSDGTQILERI